MYSLETYQRFYFRDIGAFIVRRTKTRLVWNILFGVIAVLFAGLALAVMSATWTTLDESNRIGNASVLFAGAAFALICLIINTVKGAGCSFWVQTAGGLTRMETPVRVPVARKVINTLSPLIVQAQAERPVSSSVTP